MDCDYLALDQTDVYWTNGSSVYGDGNVRRVSQQGGAVTTLFTTKTSPQGVAVDGTHVYWGDSNGGVGKASKGGGSAVLLGSSKQLVRAVAVDDDCVYWISGSNVSAALK